eukprot:jgi/Chrzof1/777/Cz01g28140.t1
MSDSEDDMPLLARAPKAAPKAVSPSDSEDDKPLLARSNPVLAAPRGKPISDGDSSESSSDSSDSDSDFEDDVPLSERKKKVTPAKKPLKASEATKRKRQNGGTEKQPAKRQKTQKGSSTRPRSNAANGTVSSEIKWTTLVHSGVLFPPEYEPHGIKMLYDGKPVDLTPAEEEVATMYAVMKETDYVKKDIFNKNFWGDFKEVLGKNHVIQSLSKCDFTPIYEWHMAEREKKKAMTKEEKLKIKEEKDAKEAKYKFALVDDRQEQVGNFRVEPPGLFRGRGEHPRQGKVKKRIYPRDIIINIGKDAPVPEHPYPGQQWREVRHDNTVTWLAYWKDTISSKDFKYVWLGANSTFKADSDLLKYEKARKLKDYITDIRANYTRDWDAKDTQRRQMAVALYFLDKLALRAGHEKDEDEADTVGCCTLKIENVDLIPPNHIKFDFLGKDSIRYENTVDVEPKVFRNVEQFSRVNAMGKAKGPRDMLFDTFDATDLNKELKSLMDGLSVKVFRTYNASITLDRLLHDKQHDTTTAHNVDEKKAHYDRANKEVAILCNHQRSVPKTHEAQMGKVQEKLDAASAELEQLQEDYKLAVKGKAPKDGRKIGNPEGMQKKIATKKQQIKKMELAIRVKEDLKTVALGTSKINYMDPRITVAWCKRNEVPIEKVFNKSLLSKFYWAMDVDWEFRF